MSDPLADRSKDRASDTPDLSTAPPDPAPTGAGPQPPRQPGWWSKVPQHLGRARTSTVVLAVLFLAVGFLYLTVRPDPVGVGRGSVEDTSSTTEPTETEPTETTEPSDTTQPTDSEPPVTSEPAAPTTSSPGGGTTEESTAPEPTARGVPENAPDTDGSTG